MYERNYNLISDKFKEFFLPTLLMSMAINTSTFIDTLIVGNTLGPINISAMALIAPIITFINLIYWMIGLGGSLLVSVSKAERNEEKADMYFTLSMVLLAVIGVLFSAFGIIFLDNIVATLTTNPALAVLVKKFLGVYFLGSPFLFVLMGIAYFIRADGKPRLSFYALLISNVVNLILDLVFILGLGMDIGGAALATISGYAVGTVFIMQYFFAKDRTMHFISLVKCKLSLVYDIITSGFPSASGQLFLTIKLFLINTFIALVAGKQGLTAFSVYYNSMFMVYIFLIGTAQSMSPIASIYYQEKDYSGVKFTIERSLKIVLASGTAFTILFLAFPSLLLNMFGVNDPADMAVGINALRILSLSIIGTGITFLMMFYTQAIQRKKLSFAISIMEGLLIPVACAYLLSGIMGVDGIWISLVVAEIGTIMMIYFATKIVSERSKGKFSGFFLLGNYKDTPVLDVTIHSSVEDVVGLSQKLIDFTKENGVDAKVALRIGMAVEEMAVNTIKFNNNEIECIDILSKIEEDEITIAFKDPGKEFNPSTYTCEEKDSFENIEVLQKIADDISYARLIGLNSTVITIKR
ncbi:MULTISPECIES: MATE family efflux transporter [Methanobacterium]|uniref:MATE family efflux transporter n=1 Tax=Methanobacterium veterum TaxID=408577 RepID=A0A9E5DKY2_9EURY|nr:MULTISPECIES: MATE family efflux transporter [Methanobacterium]MCZ3365283.1 MATE family efflux transporter [Methanobacterium veterum]MCZ3373034.1 MATE family efflux transporter [Methanobacterium veterum]